MFLIGLGKKNRTRFCNERSREEVVVIIYSGNFDGGIVKTSPTFLLTFQEKKIGFHWVRGLCLTTQKRQKKKNALVSWLEHN